jgi:hypothetical protein
LFEGNAWDLDLTAVTSGGPRAFLLSPAHGQRRDMTQPPRSPAAGAVVCRSVTAAASLAFLDRSVVGCIPRARCVGDHRSGDRAGSAAGPVRVTAPGPPFPGAVARSRQPGRPGWSLVAPWPPPLQAEGEVGGVTQGRGEQVDDSGVVCRRRGSNPPSRCTTPRGPGREGMVTCTFFVPVVTAHAQQGPSLPDAVRTQRGPVPSRRLGPVPSGRGRLRRSGPRRPETDRLAGHGKADPGVESNSRVLVGHL